MYYYYHYHYHYTLCYVTVYHISLQGLQLRVGELRHEVPRGRRPGVRGRNMPFESSILPGLGQFSQMELLKAGRMDCGIPPPVNSFLHDEFR